jgi:penicillin-binding protein 2
MRFTQCLPSIAAVLLGAGSVEGIEVAGKTGTSQAVRLKTDRKVNQQLLPREQRDHAWFVSFAPVEGPEIAVACLIEHAGGGGVDVVEVAK